MNKDASLKQHTHRGSVVSGAYYPKYPLNSAPLTLTNPLEVHKMCELYDGITKFTAGKVELPVQEGYLYLFPSWLEHGVRSNTTEERYVISFDTSHKL